MPLQYFFQDARQTFSGPGNSSAVWEFRNGVPAQLLAFNSPVAKNKNRLAQPWFFVQDKLNVARHWTITGSVRYGHYRGYFPDEKKQPGPFSEAASFKGRTAATFNNWQPRVAVVYDVFGNGKLAIKASYGRFAWYPGDTFAEAINPLRRQIDTFAVIDPNRPNPFAPDNLRLVSRASGLNAPVDPELDNAHTNEYTAGVESQIWRDFGVRFNFVRKFQVDRFQIVNRAIPF